MFLERKGIDKIGYHRKIMTKWLGYKLHAVTDTVHELPVVYEVTRASSSEQPQLREMLTKLIHNDAQVTARCENFSADRGYDGNEVYDTIRETLKARPIIDNRDPEWQVATCSIIISFAALSR